MKIYFIGIKGSGMSALANLLIDEGYQVRGSDKENYIATEEKLLQRKVIIDPLSSKNYLDADLIIIGHSFFKDDLIKELNQKQMVYFEYNEFISLYLNENKLISICGSHGKTTLVKLMSDSFEGTSFLCGDGTSRKVNDEVFFFLESCEYKRHFLAYRPKEVIITNIDYDHVDYFKSNLDYQLAFQEFVNKSERVFCLDNLKGKIKHSNMIVCSLKDRGEYNLNYKINDSKMNISFCHFKEEILNFNYKITTKEFLELLCLDLAFYHSHNFNIKKIVENINDFTFPRQRFNEIKYHSNIIISDYCHHPSQILYNLKQIDIFYPNYQKIAIFRPDRTSRLVYFKEQFKNALSKYDYAFVLPLSPTEEIKNHSSHELENENIKEIDSLKQIADIIGKKDSVISLMSSKDLSKEIEEIKIIIDKSNL